ncbi:MAG: pseudouridine synthase [Christensenellaceae bacterium]|jgi:23S rRNA-/tRNA-specific pseudouridylate synthase
MIRLEVAPGQEGAKLLEYVADMLPDIEKPKRMLRSGDIKVNGYPAKKDVPVEAGDIIEIYLPIEFEKAQKLDVVYEDKNIMVVNKQPGMPVLSKDSSIPDLMSYVVGHMQEMNEYQEAFGAIPFACFKLDVYTGGLVMFAKNGDIFEAVRAALAQRRIKRFFRAIVKGRPRYDEGEFQHFYVKDSKNRYRVLKRKVPDAVPIYTKYDVIKSNGDYSLLDVEPVTQYMNQERAHLEAAGYPVLGDATYGDTRLNRKLAIRYQALWATKIEFHTGTNNLLEYLNGKTVETNDINFPLVHMD